MEWFQVLMALYGLGAQRLDDAVARQAVINHQGSSQLCTLSFVRDATEMSIPESYAVQGLSLAHLPREAQGINLASQTPPSATGVVK